VTHAFTMSAAQNLHLQGLGDQPAEMRVITQGWQLLSISTITSGAPFTVYSGIQQTGAGTIGSDRPDQIGRPNLSTAHSSTRQREDYFGLGAANATFFSIPIGIQGGTGPNSGRFGMLGRNSFPRAGLLRLRLCCHQDNADCPSKQWSGACRPSVPRGVLQCVQRGKHGPAGEHDQRFGIWRDQQNGGDLSANSVFPQANLLRTAQSGLTIFTRQNKIEPRSYLLGGRHPDWP
jgi:hypothetical protein